MARRTPFITTRDGRTLTASQAHCAQYGEAHIPVFDRLLSAHAAAVGAPRLRVLDPMGGLGGVHHLSPLRYGTVASEIEPVFVEIARQLHPDRLTVCADAGALPFPAGSFDAVVVSPDFGNRYRDSHRNRDVCKRCCGLGKTDLDTVCRTCWGFGVSLRRSYSHDARRLAGDPDYSLDARNSGTLSAKSSRYWERQHTYWAEALRVLVPGGPLLLDVKDFVEGGKVVPVVDGHRRILDSLGFHMEAEVPVQAEGMRNGANAELRTTGHVVIVGRKVAASVEVAA